MPLPKLSPPHKEDCARPGPRTTLSGQTDVPKKAMIDHSNPTDVPRPGQAGVGGGGVSGHGSDFLGCSLKSPVESRW